MGYGTTHHDPDQEYDTAVWHAVGVADRDKLNATGYGPPAAKLRIGLTNVMASNL